jgi:hypothetical protein
MSRIALGAVCDATNDERKFEADNQILLLLLSKIFTCYSGGRNK